MTSIKGKEPSAITDREEEADHKKKKEKIDILPKSQEGITWWPAVITEEEAASPMSDEFIRRKTIEYVVKWATLGLEVIDKYFMEKEIGKVSVLSDDKDQTPSSSASK